VTINLIRSGRLYEGVPYAYAAVAPRGALVFTAGACPLDGRGEVVGPGDVRAQAGVAVANLATALAAAGATLADVLKTTVVAVLGYPGQLVEIEAVAVGGEPSPLWSPGRAPNGMVVPSCTIEGAGCYNHALRGQASARSR
jgi:hypothetical protein